MAVDSTAASLLLSSEMSDAMEVSDFDECSSNDEDEEMLVNPSKTGKWRKKRNNGKKDYYADDHADAGKDEFDYHKMYDVESRDYQNELLKLAKERNIIICLPAGTGKTYIALKLAEHMLPDAIEKNKKIIFLANTVPLVHQQAKYFSANLVCTAIQDDKYVRAITGDLNVDIWKKEQWDDLMASYHLQKAILVMSTQILVDAITKAYVKWSQLALIILDECHHAQGNHPMAELMKNYGERMANGSTDLPKVLGLTATIIKGQSKAELIPKDITDIETRLCCKAVTHKNYEEVLRHSTDNLLKTVVFQSKYSVTDSTCADVTGFIGMLDRLPRDFATEEEISLIESVNHPSLTSEEQIFNKDKGVPKTLKSFLIDLLKSYEELGPYCCKMAAIHKFISLSQWIQQLEEVTPWGEEIMKEEKLGVVVLLYNAQTAVVQFMKRLERKMAEEAAKKPDSDTSKNEAYIVRHCISDKVNVLWNILKNQRPSQDGGQDELCGLVFCQRRITALVLRWYLQTASELWPEELGFIRPELMVGHSTIVQNTEAARVTARRQTEVIRKFHAKELNLIVATNVLEEGLNVPLCNLVVRFDIIQTYPSFVQSMGRARKKGAICYALIEQSEVLKEETKLLNYRRYNRSLSHALEQNAIHVGEEVDDVNIGIFDVPIKPFCPTDDPDGPIITATDAVSLVHRYCNSLNCDRIGALKPTAFWDGRKKLNKSSYKGYVVLPILSPIREVVEGEWMPDKVLAKRSAYLEVCKRLHEACELTENLLPKPRSISNYKCEFLDTLAGKFEVEKSTTNAKIGSQKRVQQYKKAIPKALVESRVQPNTAVSIYKIEITLKDYTRDVESKKLFDFGRFSLFYGIVTTANLDDIPLLELSANYGTYTVSLKKCKMNGRSEITLTEAEIIALESFQVFLCNSVYNVKNFALIPDKQHSILIAPIRKRTISNFEIEWKIVSHSSPAKDHQIKPDEDCRKHFRFHPELYENALLVPWYKEDSKEPELLCAINTLDGSSSLSEFDEPMKFPTYQHYYKAKYNVDIHNPDAPLIMCKSIGTQLNFLIRKDGKALRKDMQRSILKIVPELVNIHTLPASLYIQGRLLPSILHRIYRLELANELRLEVASYFQWTVNMPMEERNMELEEEDSESGMEIDLGLENALQEITFELCGQEKTPSKKKEDLLLLEEINPLEISWDTISRSVSSAPKRRNPRARDTRFDLPEPPVRKSNFGFELMPFDDIEFPSFDKLTDFKKERGPSMQTLMEALTLSNAQDCVSLEKLEVMGDSVLKVIVSLHIFRSFPQWDEGKMTLLRMKLISNQHLYQIGKAHNLGELLSGSFFIPPAHWMPWGFTVPKYLEEWLFSNNMDYEMFKSLLFDASSASVESLEVMLSEMDSGDQKNPSAHTTFSHSRIGDKSIADSLESILGAYYMNGGLDGAFRIMEFMGLKGPLLDGSAVEYSRETTLSPPKEDTQFKKSGDPSKFVPLLKDLEEILNYKFKNKWLAVEALTHPTFMANRSTPCYERLEFVGDAILDFLVTNYILKKTNITDPGEITDLRAALVNNVTFASLAVRYGFHSFLKYESEMLASYISQFVQYQEENGHTVSDPYKLLSDFDCPTVREIEVPKVLGDVFESIAGAIFVDSGMSIDTVWKVFYRLMRNELELFSKKIPKNPLRQLYEKYPTQVKFRKLPSDTSANPKSKNHCASKFQAVFLKVPCCETYILGVGNTIKQAKQAAAKFVIRGLK